MKKIMSISIFITFFFKFLFKLRKKIKDFQTYKNYGKFDKKNREKIQLILNFFLHMIETRYEHRFGFLLLLLLLLIRLEKITRWTLLFRVKFLDKFTNKSQKFPPNRFHSFNSLEIFFFFKLCSYGVILCSYGVFRIKWHVSGN